MIVIMLGHHFGGVYLAITMSFANILFFISSGMTSKFTSNKSTIYSDTKKLFYKAMLPPIITFTGLNVFLVLRRLYYHKSPLDLPLCHPVKYILSLVFFRCGDITVGRFTIPSVGILWFFATFFTGWTIYNILQKYLPKPLLPILCVIASILGVILGKHQIALPLNADISLAIIPAFYAGQLISNRLSKDRIVFERHPFIKLITYSVAFLLLGYYYNSHSGYFNMSAGVYPLYPLCIIAAILGTLACFYVFIILDKIKLLTRPLSNIGKNSLYLLCIHAIDYSFASMWERSSNSYINFLLRLGIDLIGMLILKLIFKKLLKHHAR